MADKRLCRNSRGCLLHIKHKERRRLAVASKKKTGESEKPVKKRVRRNPELLMEELDEKLKKLEVKVYRKNADFIHQVGVEIFKLAGFRFARLTEAERKDVKDMTAKGQEMARKILTDAWQNMTGEDREEE